jgi:hypothetical protein
MSSIAFRPRVVLAWGIGFVLGTFVGCQPRAYFVGCESDDDCPARLDCLPSPYDEDAGERVCTRSCDSTRDCPRRNNDHCGKRHECTDGVCGDNRHCR